MQAIFIHFVDHKLDRLDAPFTACELGEQLQKEGVFTSPNLGVLRGFSGALKIHDFETAPFCVQKNRTSDERHRRCAVVGTHTHTVSGEREKKLSSETLSVCWTITACQFASEFAGKWNAFFVVNVCVLFYLAVCMFSVCVTAVRSNLLARPLVPVTRERVICNFQFLCLFNFQFRLR